MLGGKNVIRRIITDVLMEGESKAEAGANKH
jgi:hypothetical protein